MELADEQWLEASNGGGIQFGLPTDHLMPLSPTIAVSYTPTAPFNRFVRAASCSPTASPTVADRFYKRLPHYPVAFLSFRPGAAPLTGTNNKSL